MNRLGGRWRLLIVSLLVAAQVVFVVGAVAREEYLLNTGTEIRLQTRPVGPWDVLRGQFVDLGYEIDDVSDFQRFRWLGDRGDTLYVVLAEGDDGFWTAVDASRERESETSRPDGTVVIRAEVVANNTGIVRVEYNNIRRFYVPDGTEDPETDPVAVVVVHGDREARLKRLEVDGVSWP